MPYVVVEDCPSLLGVLSEWAAGNKVAGLTALEIAGGIADLGGNEWNKCVAIQYPSGAIELEWDLDHCTVSVEIDTEGNSLWHRNRK